MKATIFKSQYETDSPNHVEVSHLLDRIRDGKQKDKIDVIRGGDKSKKSELPLVLFSGEFSGRKDQDIIRHSGLVVLDFDHIDTQKSKPLIGSDPYVYACWVSPSGDGLKALVRVAHSDRHRDHFRALSEYFDNQYGVEPDPTGINESRGCYESYDPDLIVNEDASVFGKFVTEKAQTQTAEIQSVGTDYMKLNLAAMLIRKADDGEKHSALLRASVLMGGYIAAGRVEEDEAVRVLMREILKRDIDSEYVAKNTIRDGIEHGKTLPIRDILNDSRDAEREMLINDGDMSFISSRDEDYGWIEKFANGEIALGLDTGDENLDKFFRYKKEFVIINGHSNVGKTTMALYMMVNASVRHGWKWLVYSSENHTHSVKATLMEFAFNMKVQTMNSDQRKLAYQWVCDHFTLISNKELYSYMDMILFMEKVKAQQDIDAVFLDPYNSLKIDMHNKGISTHEYHYEAASEFLTYSSYNNVAVWLNMHAVTEAQRRKGPDGLPLAPYAEDTEGGGKFVNRSDCFLTIHRKVQAPNYEDRITTELHVRKVREVKTGGSPTPLDLPITFRMNKNGTGFASTITSSEMFESVGYQFSNYRQFNINLDT